MTILIVSVFLLIAATVSLLKFDNLVLFIILFAMFFAGAMYAVFDFGVTKMKLLSEECESLGGELVNEYKTVECWEIDSSGRMITRFKLNGYKGI